MNFGFSEEQELLRAELRKFLDQNAPLEAVRKQVELPDGFDRGLYRRMAELGWVGLAAAEEQGGIGLGWVDLVVVLEETGRSLFPSPFVASQLAIAAIQRFGSAEQRARWLPGLASGERLGCVALQESSDELGPAGVELTALSPGGALVLSGEKHFALDAGAADLFVVAFRQGKRDGDLRLAVLERGEPGVSARRLQSIDATQRPGLLTLEGVRLAPDRILAQGAGAAPLAWLQDAGALAVTAESLGAADAALALTVGYAKQRVQFGERIGRFQGVKHPLAEMYVDIESCRSLLYYAAWALDESPAEAPLAVSRAKAYTSEFFPKMGIDVIQLHGAIGYTAEYAAQLFLKRAKWMRPAFGDAAWHYERVASLLGAA